MTRLMIVLFAHYLLYFKTFLIHLVINFENYCYDYRIIICTHLKSNLKYLKMFQISSNNTSCNTFWIQFMWFPTYLKIISLLLSKVSETRSKRNCIKLEIFPNYLEGILKGPISSQKSHEDIWKKSTTWEVV